MKKFFSLVLALVMALSLTTVAWGAPSTPVTTIADLNTAIADAGVDTIIVNAPITVSGTVVINLNGKTLDASACTSRPFEMADGASLTINATGSTVKVGAYGLVKIPADNDAAVILNGGTYTGNTDKGSFVKPLGSGVISIELNGVNYTDSSAKNWLIDGTTYSGSDLTITVNGGSYDVWCGITAHYADITVKNAVFNVKSVGIESGLGSTALVENCTITASGGDNAAAPTAALVASNDGTMTVKGGTYTGSSNASTDGKNAAAIYPTGGSITVESGTLDGDVKMWNSDSAKEYEVTISGGTVTGEFETTASEDIDVTITGGSFPNADVTDYLAEGYRFDAATGEVTAMPATGVGKYDLYDQDGDLAEENITAEYTDSYEKKGAGNIGYWKLTVDGVTYSYYIECSRTKAEMYLTLADNTGVYKYLKHVEYVDYVATGKAYTNIGDDCGELDVGAKAKAYVLADEDGNKTYWIADEDGDTVIMVGDELVLVSEVEGGLVPHTWVVTAYNDDEEPITAKCKECPATAKLYKTKLAAPVGATFAGQIAGYYVVVDGTTPSTDKVTSAETFDAGIAMYVGMSVMAAAGSAVVIGKKKD